MIDIILGSLAVVSISVLLFLYIKSIRDKRTLMKAVLISGLDRDKLISKIDSLSQELDNAKLSDNNEFVKFLSDSREWAFSYIEEFQGIVEQISKTYSSGNETERASLIAKLILLLPEDHEKPIQK